MNDAAPPSRPAAVGVPDGNLARWLRRIDAGIKAAPARREKLAYVVTLKERPEGARAIVDTALLRWRRLDAAPQIAPAPPIEMLARSAPRPFMEPVDGALCLALWTLGETASRDTGAGDVLTGPGSGRVFADMIATGRCFWDDPATPALAPGATRAGRLAWSDAHDGRRRLTVAGDGIAVVVPLSPPWYVDPAAGIAGPIALDLPEPLAEALVQGPSVREGDLALIAAELAQRFPDRPELQPPGARLLRMEGGPAVRIGLSATSLGRRDAFRDRGAPRIPVVFCDMSFRYGDAVFPATADSGYGAVAEAVSYTHLTLPTKA